jgi:proline racemase
MPASIDSALQDWKWRPPAHWTRITTVDMHTGGEPLRVLLSGMPPLEGDSVLEKVRYFREHYDYIRTGLIWEPRGHADMYGAVVTTSRNADFDVFFLHNEGYSTMCGHAIIALTTLAFDTGLIDKKDSATEIAFAVPAGIVKARATFEDSRVREVAFRNVPSFLYRRDEEVDVTGLGRVRFDVAYGGAFYAIVEAAPLGLDLTASHYDRLIDYGRRIKHAVQERFTIEHPLEKDLSFLYGTIFTGAPHEAGHHSRNVCVFANGEVDRSATGSGVSARAALHVAKGELRLGETITIESITGSTMNVCAAERTRFASYEAIVPEVSGRAFITGTNTFYFDPEDDFRQGFILR